MKQFDITYFEGPGADYATKKEVWEDVKNAGITLCQLWFTYDVETNRKALQLLRECGLRGIVYENRLLELCRSGEIEKADDVVRTVLQDYEGFEDVIVGWEIFDEPSAKLYPMLGKVTELIRKYAPEQETVVNLFPNYASNEMLEAGSYREYIEEFILKTNPDFLSYDYYPFAGRDVQKKLSDDLKETDAREYGIREAAMRKEDRLGYFENLRDVRELGLKYNVEQMVIVQLTEHGVYRNLTKEELLWQVNMCLAYGMHRISYFTYWLPMPNEFWTWDQSMCDREGNKYQHYYDAKSVNEHIYPIGQILFEHTSEAVFHLETGEKAVTEFAGYGDLEKIEGERGVIGFFQDGYVYIVNHDYRQERTYTLYSRRDMQIYDGDFKPAGKEFAITVKPGDGCLLRFTEH